MYERTFGTDWQTIDDPEEVVKRAFALGVAARLGETHPGELDRLGGQIDTTYDRSLVKLAYQKGRNQADAADAEGDEAVWEELVGEKTTLHPPSESTDADFDDESAETDDTIPDALRRIDIDTLPDDSTDRVKRPSFLDRHDSGGHPGIGGKRSVFGRSMGGGRRGRSDRTGDDGTGTEEATDEDVRDGLDDRRGPDVDTAAEGAESPPADDRPGADGASGTRSSDDTSGTRSADDEHENE